MSDKTLNEAGEALPIEGQSSGQAEGQAGQSRNSDNWDDHPGVRRAKSLLDQEKAARDRERAEFERQLSELKATVDGAVTESQTLKQFVSQYDPDAATEFMREAELERLRQENARFQQMEAQRRAEQQAHEEAVAYHVEMAEAMGLDPDDPRYVEALNTGDNAVVEFTRAQMLMEKNNMSINRGEPQPVEDNSAEDHDNVVLPARGTSPIASPESRLAAQYEERKLKLRPGDINGLIELQKEFIDKGLPMVIGAFNSEYEGPN